MGVRLVDPGNIVHATDPGLDRDAGADAAGGRSCSRCRRAALDDVRDAMARGPVEVTAFDQDNRRALGTGKLLLIDNVIDQATATIRLKAMFANDDEQLWPGEFVNARVLLETRRNVARDALDRRAARAAGPVHLDRDRRRTRSSRARSRSARRTGDLTVVTSGLSEGERVVTDGQYKLQRERR